MSSLNVEVTFHERFMFPPDARPYKVIERADVTAQDAEAIPAAVAKVQAAMTRITFEQAEEFLAMLQAACAHRSEGEASSNVGLTLYASCLAQFPADVAKAACMNMALRKTKGPNWFPTLSELNAECERLASTRKAMLSALTYNGSRRFT